MIRVVVLFFLCVCTTISWCQKVNNLRSNQKTICNPLNLSYRFCLDEPSRREAADPTVILYKDDYYLFASKSGGYWHSTDLVDWDFITSYNLPTEDYAPTVVVIQDTLYFMASSGAPVTIYKTSNPKEGKWDVAVSNFPIGMTDPDLFLDDDGRLYFYYGCSNVNPIYGIELNPTTFTPIGEPVVCFNSNKKDYGWEQMGDYNQQTSAPWIEGAWMTKFKGKYYLQYAAPGTEFKSYCDGVYVSDSPLGPFQLGSNNPLSAKPEGFIAGAGHSSTFQDKYGNYWHISTMTISKKHMFERRLGLFPLFFDNDRVPYVNTRFGDFPFQIPNQKIAGPEEISPKWMLLSYKKPVTVSSESKDHPKINITDEEIRTYWSAETGARGEWVSIDLQHQCEVNAVQINFADDQTSLHNRNPNQYHQYLIEYSEDNMKWIPIADRTKNLRDVPHDYIEIATPIQARYIRLTNYHVPDGSFAISGLRVFGDAKGSKTKPLRKISVVRKSTDKREVTLKWNKSDNAIGYYILYGNQPDKLYHSYQVLDTNTLVIRSLNRLKEYYFRIDSFNESGVTKGNKIFKTN